MRHNKLFLVIATGACLLALLAMIAWRQHAKISEARQILAAESTLQQNLQKQLAASRRQQEQEALRVLTLQNTLHRIDLKYWSNESHWREIEALVAKLKTRQKEAAVSPAPATPRRARAPSSASGGVVFPELLNDPAYLALAKESWSSLNRNFLYRFMYATELPDTDKLTRIESILDEARSMEMDVHAAAAALGADEITDKVVEKLRKDIIEKQNAALMALVGEDNFKKFKQSMQAGDGTVMTVGWINVDSLATRLSYSNEPLTENQFKQMRELMIADSKSMTGKSWDDEKREQMTSDEFNTRAAEILTSVQLQGLRELQDEKSAWFELFDKGRPQPTKTK